MDEEVSEGGSAGGRPIWSGTVSFGLVSVPVMLYPANRPKRVSLHMVTDEGTQLVRRYFTASGDKPLDDDDIVRGFEVKKGKYVIVDDEDLERLAPERTRDIDLKQFVDVADLDPVYFERAYYMVPTQGGSKAYRLLARVMEETGRAGIATFVMRAKEYLVALIAENGVLRAETLRFADEIRTPETVGLPKPAKVSPADLRKMQTQMKKFYKTKLNPKELIDTSAEQLVKIAQKKAKKGEEVVHPTEAPEPQDNVFDLVERLQRSLNGGKAPAHRAKKSPAHKTTRRKRAKKTA